MIMTIMLILMMWHYWNDNIYLNFLNYITNTNESISWVSCFHLLFLMIHIRIKIRDNSIEM